MKRVMLLGCLLFQLWCAPAFANYLDLVYPPGTDFGTINLEVGDQFTLFVGGEWDNYINGYYLDLLYDDYYLNFIGVGFEDALGDASQASRLANDYNRDYTIPVAVAPRAVQVGEWSSLNQAELTAKQAEENFTYLFSITFEAERPTSDLSWLILTSHLAGAPFIYTHEGATSWVIDNSDLVCRISPVPEPGSILFLGAGLLGLIAVARTRWRKK